MELYKNDFRNIINISREYDSDLVEIMFNKIKGGYNDFSIESDYGKSLKRFYNSFKGESFNIYNDIIDDYKLFKQYGGASWTKAVPRRSRSVRIGTSRRPVTGTTGRFSRLGSTLKKGALSVLKSPEFQQLASEIGTQAALGALSGQSVKDIATTAALTGVTQGIPTAIERTPIQQKQLIGDTTCQLCDQCKLLGTDNNKCRVACVTCRKFRELGVSPPALKEVPQQKTITQGVPSTIVVGNKEIKGLTTVMDDGKTYITRTI